MKQEVELHLVGKRSFATDNMPPEWRDDHELLALTPRLRRMLVDNPLSHSDEDPVLAVATVGDRVAGRVVVMPGELLVEGEPVPALWGLALEVSADFRKLGIGTKLVASWQNANPTAVGNSVNIISQGLYHRLGWEMFHTPSYQLVCSSEPFLKGYLKSGSLAALLSPVADLGLKARRALSGLRSTRTGSGYETEHLRQVPDGLDPLLARQTRKVSAHRSARWLNWLLGCDGEQRRDNYRFFLVRDRAGEPVGYFLLSIIRHEKIRGRFENVELGAVKEWAVFDDTRANDEAVVLLALRELLSAGVHAILIAVPGAETGVVSMLEKFKFKRRDDLRTSFFAHPSSPMTGEEFKNPDSWRHSWANSDGLFL